MLVGIKNSQCKGRAREATTIFKEKILNKSRSEVCECWKGKGTCRSGWIYCSWCERQNSVWASSYKILYSCASFCWKQRQWSRYGVSPSKILCASFLLQFCYFSWHSLSVGTIIKRQLHNNFSGLFFGLPFTKPNPEFVQSVKSQFQPQSKILVVCQEGLRLVYDFLHYLVASYTNCPWSCGRKLALIFSVLNFTFLEHGAPTLI